MKMYKKYKTNLDFTYGEGDGAYKWYKTDNGINVMVQEQHNGYCVMHACNNVLQGRHLYKVLSEIRWNVLTQNDDGEDTDYKDGGYRKVHINTFLKNQNIDYVFKKANECFKSCFIEHWNKARHGILLGVTGHEMCVRKDFLANGGTFIDSNYPKETISLDSGKHIYEFVKYTHGWEKPYLMGSKVLDYYFL